MSSRYKFLGTERRGNAEIVLEGGKTSSKIELGQLAEGGLLLVTPEIEKSGAAFDLHLGHIRRRV